MKLVLIFVACVACGGPTAAPSRTVDRRAPASSDGGAMVAAPDDTGAAVSDVPWPRSASRTASSFVSERWTFAESKLKPLFEPIETVSRPENMFVTADARNMIIVGNLRDYEVRSPHKSTHDPTRELAWPYVRLSPRGDYAAVVTESRPSKWDVGSDVAVIRFSDHAVMTTIEGGADPFWIDSSVLAFRVGNQAQRLELPSLKVTDVGSPQTTHGCPNAALRGYTRVDESMCPSGRYSRVVAVDAAYTKWLVVDDDGAHETALRLVDLASGRDRVLADRKSHGYPLYVTVSPHGTRYCMTPKHGKAGYRLYCGRFPEADDQVKVMELSGDTLPRTDWLDDDRFLLSPNKIIDLANGKQLELDAKLASATTLSGNLGPHYVVARMGWVYVLDLETKTWTRLDTKPAPDATDVLDQATAAGRLWVTQITARAATTDLFELRLVPK
ncbi:MAG TPA: hypothetical protein VFV99_33380 [Kofleriaceae bacterium]|nr:hypothetical protein [Kofleriaceae bacterium]